jgi:hypothetical protein
MTNGNGARIFRSMTAMGALALGCAAVALAGEGGPPGHALVFGDPNQKDDFVQIADAPEFHNDAFTIEMWVRPMAPMEGFQHLIAKPWDTSVADSFVLWLRATDEIAFDCYAAGERVTIPNPLIEGQWSHVAASNDANMRRIYVDGTERGSNVGGVPRWDANPVLVGADINNGTMEQYFRGIINEVRIWDHVRTETQLQENMYRALTGTEPGLVAYWRFDDGTGQLATDSSPSANHGILGNDAFPGGDSGDPQWIEMCPSDFNGDGVVNSQDFVAFLNAFSVGHDSADFDGNGAINSQDFVAFLNAFVAGC